MTNRRTIIKIQRRGGNNNDAIIENHAREIINQMFSTRMANTLRITIKLRAGVEKAYNGFCEFRDMSKSSTAKSKHYTISIQRDLPLLQQLKTLTHELAHVEQMATNRLAFRSTYGVYGHFWRPVGHRGAAIKYNAPKGRSNTPWAERPWEIEAIAADKKYEALAVKNARA